MDDRPLCDRVARLMVAPDVLVGPISGRDDLARMISTASCDLAVIEGAGVTDDVDDLIRRLMTLPDRPLLIVILHGDESQTRARLLAEGAFAVLDASLDDGLLSAALHRLVGQRRDAQRRHFDLHRRPAFEGDLVFRSELMQGTVNTARKVARADSPVLLLGETGVGKERLAMLIHASSPRSRGPFIAVNCAALPAELFESELFGHEKGAFTGASRARRGHFELAHEGTLFLDEVGEVPLHLQAKLLRVLQEHRIKPLGAEHSLEVDVRVLAATNRELEEEMAKGHFRRDLYYRLGVVELRIPSLRERQDDVEAMADEFLRRYASALNRDVEGFSRDALDALERYHWPGNVRELANVVERAVLLCQDRLIRLSDLPPSIAVCSSDRFHNEGVLAGALPPGEGPVVALPTPWVAAPWKVVREELLIAGEKAYLQAVLESCDGRVGEAAKRAGISSRALFEKMKRHGLRKEDFRPRRV